MRSCSWRLAERPRPGRTRTGHRCGTELAHRLGKTALLIACERGSEALAARMLAAGTDVNLASLERVTPLMAASYGGFAPLVKSLLAAGAKTDPSTA